MSQLYSVESEQGLLGSVLKNPTLINDLTLCPEDFYREQHRTLFTAMTSMANEKVPIDTISIVEWLMARGQLELVGGSTYLLDLEEITSGNLEYAEHYANIIKDYSVKRSLIVACQDGVEIVKGAPGEKCDVLLDRVQSSIMSINSPSRGGACQISEIVRDVDAEILDNISNAGTMTGIPTGIQGLDMALGGWQPTDLIVMAGRPGMGKAQPLHCNVLMQDGSFKKIGDLIVGDRIASVDGRPSTVDGVFDRGKMAVYRITFSDGRSTMCSRDHLWRVGNRKWHDEYRILDVAQIIDLLQKPSYANRIYIDMVDGNFGNDTELPIEPYVLGVMLGDGTIGRDCLRVSTQDTQIIHELRAGLFPDCILKYDGGCDFKIKNPVRCKQNKMLDKMRILGLCGCKSYDKFIPTIYKESSLDQRMELLRGLMDTDGWVEKNGSIRFSTSSYRLANDVCDMIRSIGGVCRIKNKLTTYTYNGDKRNGAIAYLCKIRMNNKESIFKLQRKKDRCSNINGLRLNITSIEECGFEPVRCIKVSHPSSLYVTDDYIVTHNTAVMLNFLDNAARIRYPVGCFSVEMASKQLVYRLISRRTGISYQRMKLGLLNPGQAEFIRQALAEINGLPITIDDRSSITELEIVREARRMKREKNVQMIAIDYLQRIKSARPSRSEAEELGKIVQTFKNLARELEIPVMVLSQLNRKVEERDDKRPMLSDLKSSGDIEQEADIIALLYRDEYYNPETPRKGVIEIDIAKFRNGVTRRYEFGWDGKSQSIFNLSHGED